MSHRPCIHRGIPQTILPEILQSCEHIIRTCPRYAKQRAKLQKEHHELALPELLGTPKGIAALAEFIKDSGAFTFTGKKYTPT